MKPVTGLGDPAHLDVIIEKLRAPLSAADPMQPLETRYRPGSGFERKVVPLPAVLVRWRPSQDEVRLPSRVLIALPVGAICALALGLGLCLVAAWPLSMLAFLAEVVWASQHRDLIASISLTELLRESGALAFRIGLVVALLSYVLVTLWRMVAHWRQLGRVAARLMAPPVG